MLRTYGAVSAAGFFAVSTEAFFNEKFYLYNVWSSVCS